MVMYRDFAQRKARGLGIVGTVQNLRDGTVEVSAQGTPEALDKYLEKLKRGSLLSRVDRIDIEWQNVTLSRDDFVILY